MVNKDSHKNSDEWAGVDPLIPPRDEQEALTRPSHLGETHKERECDAAGLEQVERHTEEGEREARPYDIKATEAAEAAEAAEASREQLREGAAQHLDFEALWRTAVKLLRPYMNRPEHAKVIYWIFTVGLLLGDIIGIRGASLLLGEDGFDAAGQAIAAGVAAITLGAIGSELKKLAQRRSRAAEFEELPDDYQPFRQLFTGKTPADTIVSSSAAARSVASP